MLNPDEKKDDQTQTPPQPSITVHHQSTSVGVEAHYLGTGVRFFMKHDKDDVQKVCEDKAIEDKKPNA